MISHIPSSKIFQVDNSHFDLEELEKKLDKKSVIVVHATPLSDAALALLEKILSAINVQLNEDVLLVHLSADQKLPLGRLLRNTPIRLILNFSCKPKQLKMNIEGTKYAVLRFSECNFISSDSIEELQKNKQLKMLLWNALKTCAFK